jgi:plastocyanin
MRRRVITVAGVVMAIGAGVGVAAAATPADSPSSTASFTATDFAWNVSGGTSTEADIAAGGTVTFAYPTGTSDHNADFGSGPQPTSCAQTAGTGGGAVPPLPHLPTASGWSGTCTFATAGTYIFHCDMHPFMTGTIVVGSAPAPPGGSTPSQPTTPPSTSTPTTSTSTTPALTTTTTSPVAPHQPAGPAIHAIALAGVQHGLVVHGSLSISGAARGGRLQVQLFAAGHRRAGSLARRALPAGHVRFAVALNAATRRALRRRGRLALTVAIAVSWGKGARTSVTRHVWMEADRGSTAGRDSLRPAGGLTQTAGG